MPKIGRVLDLGIDEFVGTHPLLVVAVVAIRVPGVQKMFTDTYLAVVLLASARHANETTVETADVTIVGTADVTIVETADVTIVGTAGAMIVETAGVMIVEIGSVLIVDIAGVTTVDLVGVTTAAIVNETKVATAQEATDPASMIAGRLVARGRVAGRNPTVIILALPPPTTTKSETEIEIVTAIAR